MARGKRVLHYVIGEVECKPCSRCKKILPLTDFSKTRSSTDGYNYLCKECFKVNYTNSPAALAYRITRKEDKKEYDKFYNRKNQDKKRLRARAWRENNREKYRQYFNDKGKKDENFRLARNLRNRIVKVLRGVSKSASTMNLIGCSISELKEYLGSRFTDEMTWDNYGIYWHVDHIIPCAAFDLSDPTQQSRCFHYTNLQPMEATANIKKNSSMPDGTYIKKRWNFS